MRVSVAPAASYTQVPVGNPITAARPPAQRLSDTSPLRQTRVPQVK
jgi:hypothetical protein